LEIVFGGFAGIDPLVKGDETTMTKKSGRKEGAFVFYRFLAYTLQVGFHQKMPQWASFSLLPLLYFGSAIIFPWAIPDI